MGAGIRSHISAEHCLYDFYCLLLYCCSALHSLFCCCCQFAHLIIVVVKEQTGRGGKIHTTNNGSRVRQNLRRLSRNFMELYLFYVKCLDDVLRDVCCCGCHLRRCEDVAEDRMKYCAAVHFACLRWQRNALTAHQLQLHSRRLHVGTIASSSQLHPVCCRHMGAHIAVPYGRAKNWPVATEEEPVTIPNDRLMTRINFQTRGLIKQTSGPGSRAALIPHEPPG